MTTQDVYAGSGSLWLDDYSLSGGSDTLFVHDDAEDEDDLFSQVQLSSTERSDIAFWSQCRCSANKDTCFQHAVGMVWNHFSGRILEQNASAAGPAPPATLEEFLERVNFCGPADAANSNGANADSNRANNGVDDPLQLMCLHRSNAQKLCGELIGEILSKRDFCDIQDGHNLMADGGMDGMNMNGMNTDDGGADEYYRSGRDGAHRRPDSCPPKEDFENIFGNYQDQEHGTEGTAGERRLASKKNRRRTKIQKTDDVNSTTSQTSFVGGNTAGQQHRSLVFPARQTRTPAENQIHFWKC